MGISTNRICLLTTTVANQIAAGEVIERPASVVKELLENALDAGANAISIEIGFGGLNQVKISDNGGGILADDLPLAVAAHATSKITKLTDLYAISSMGFRGEALASIASVSRLSIFSKPVGQAHAMMMQMDGEKMSLTPCARNQGTTIDVRDLFFNAPVRKKFLKTERSEYQAIEVVVKRFALSAPEVAISLKHNDKPMLTLPSALCEQSKLQRIKKILGSEFVDKAIYLDVERAGMRLQGWVSGQEYQRSQNDKQWIYINQRMVKDKLLNHALKQSYEGLLHPGRHPACVLYLTIAPDQVDVNVHPTKHEVRFQQPRLVHDLMTSQILQALAVGEDAREYSSQQMSTHWEIREEHVDATRRGRVFSGKSVPSDDILIRPAVHLLPEGEGSRYSSWLILNTRFAIIDMNNEPWLFDVESAQQQRLAAMLSQQTYPMLSRPLLVPVNVAIDKKHYSQIEQLLPLLIDLGIGCDFASESSLIVRTIPLILPATDIQSFLQGLTSVIPTRDNLLKHLVVCQSFDIRQLNHDEKMELMAHMSPQSGVRMDIATCRGLFDV